MNTSLVGLAFAAAGFAFSRAVERLVKAVTRILGRTNRVALAGSPDASRKNVDELD